MRKWTVKGGKLMSGAVVIHCDGPVPEINENIPVVETAALKLLELCEEKLMEEK